MLELLVILSFLLHNDLDIVRKMELVISEVKHCLSKW